MHYMEEKDIKIEFLKRFRPLPKGYSVWWLDGLEHYVGIGPNGEESPIQSSRFQARKWCFAHHTEKNKKTQRFDAMKKSQQRPSFHPKLLLKSKTKGTFRSLFLKNFSNY